METSRSADSVPVLLARRAIAGGWGPSASDRSFPSTARPISNTTASSPPRPTIPASMQIAPSRQRAQPAPVQLTRLVLQTTCTSVVQPMTSSALQWSSRHACPLPDRPRTPHSVRLHQHSPTVQVQRSRVEQEQRHASMRLQYVARSVLATRPKITMEATCSLYRSTTQLTLRVA